MSKRLLDVKELSQYTGIPEWTIRKLVYEKKIPVTRVNRRIYFDLGRIDQWLALRTIEPSDPECDRYYKIKTIKEKSAIEVRLPLDEGSETLLNFFSVSKAREKWQRWDKGVYVRDSTVYLSYQMDGRRIKEPLGPESSITRTLARKARAVRLAEIAQGKFKIDQVKKTPTLGTFSEEYLQYVKHHNLSWRRSEDHIVHFKAFFGLNCKLSTVTTTRIEKYKANRLEKVKPLTVNRELACLKHMFNTAIKWGRAWNNPVKGVRFLESNEPKEIVLTPEQEATLLQASPLYLRQVILTALNTGMRLGELERLKWSDVDMVNRAIFVRRTKSKKPRRVPINSLVDSLLLTLRSRNGHQDHVFLNSKGEPIRSLRTTFNTARRKAGLSDLRFHDLRHTAATRMAVTGRLDIVRKVLGHSVINVTMRYVHPNEEDERAVVESLTTKRPDFVPLKLRDTFSDNENDTQASLSAEENRGNADVAQR
jgi:excisionase family DNA binding protein